MTRILSTEQSGIVFQYTNVLCSIWVRVRPVHSPLWELRLREEIMMMRGRKRVLGTSLVPGQY
jgi:hypothetical protein